MKKAFLAIRDRKDQRETKVIRVMLDPRVNKELRDCKAQKATWERLVRRD